MQNPPSPNRRLVGRTACGLSVSYRRGDGWHPATAVDLSSRGCRLRLGEDLPRGSGVSVRLQCSGEAGAKALEAEVDGRVIWTRLEGLSYQAGIQFDTEPSGLAELLAEVG